MSEIHIISKMKNSDIILDVKNLSKTYSVEKGFFKKK